MTRKTISGLELVPPSRRLFGVFSLYLRWYIGRHFHGLRIANPERFPREVDGPLIVYINHSSWWDPLTCILISRRFLPYANHHAPMDEAALQHYGFFAKLGIFPVELDTHRGAIQFLRSATQVLTTPNSVLWLTPEGRFADPRTKPLVFKEGLASLLRRVPSVTLVPLAIEYVYWDERLPEILVNPGNPIRIHHSNGMSVDDANSPLTGALSAAQAELAGLAVARNAGNFESILQGGAGTSIVYDLWRRMLSTIRHQPYHPEHGSIRRP